MRVSTPVAVLTPDAGTAKPIPHAVPVISRPNTTKPLQFSPTKREHDDVNELSSSASDDAMNDVRPHAKYPHWSLKELEEETGKIVQLQELIAHFFMLIDSKIQLPIVIACLTALHLTHVQRSRRILQDECRTMLQGLHRSLNVLFYHFEYNKDT